jgi:hypothetical protein
VERIGQDDPAFGVTVRYLLNDYDVAVDFEAWRNDALGADDEPLYPKRNHEPNEFHLTPTTQNAEKYLSGFVRWDGRFGVTFGDGDGYLDVWDIGELASILRVIYNRGGEIIAASGTQLLENTFPDRDTIEPADRGIEHAKEQP